MAVTRYFEDGHHENSSVLLEGRFNTLTKGGISVQDGARYEVGGVIALLVNIVPASFRLIFLIYSHPELLDDIRNSVETILTTTTENGAVVRTLDIANLKTKMSPLNIYIPKVLRHRSIGTSVRQVTTNTLLCTRWLLKKDAMIQMPNRVFHTDPSIWGPDASSFHPRRFFNTNSKLQQASRAFGGGTTLYPGRHFATAEVLAVRDDASYVV